MDFVKCFDAVEMVVEEANKQFSPIWKMNEENYRVLERYCEVIDDLAAECGGESYEVEIDDIAMTVAITMECPDLIVKQHGGSFHALVSRAMSIKFSVSQEGNLLITFVFPSLWQRA